MTGPTTVANLFGHMGGRTKGLVQIWDVVGFDEVADLEKMAKEVITTMKTYCESGTLLAVTMSPARAILRVTGYRCPIETKRNPKLLGGLPTAQPPAAVRPFPDIP